MKFTAVLLGSQLLVAALAIATPGTSALIARNIEAREPAVVVARADAQEDQDVYNGSGCLKRKRNAENAAVAAATAYKRYADALSARSLDTRESDEKDQDVYNGSSCLKLKREAEALAIKSREASAEYEMALAKRVSFV